MKFKRVALYLERLESTSSRIEITKILAELFSKASSVEIDKITYLILGTLAPRYEGIVFDMADKMVVRAMAQVFNREISEVFSLYKEKGDLGIVAGELGKKIDGKDLSVSDVFRRLLEITKDEGEGSQERKVTKLADLISDLDGLSNRFVVRIPLGRLRLGFSEKTILDALSWMVKGDKSAKNSLEKAYFVLPDPGLLVKKVKEDGIEKAVSEVKPVVGVPVEPMLAQRLKTAIEMIKKMGKVSVEPKLDGLRLSIHFKRKNGFTKAFTRNLNETSWMFPELQRTSESLDANEVILDCEAVGLNEETKKLVDFQTTMTRRRKHEIEETLKKIGIEFYVFDILFKDGKNLMDEPYLKRREVLEKTIKKGSVFKLVDYKITENSEDITRLYSEKVREGLEGVLVKKLDSQYVPGRTGWRWVKMKQSETSVGKLADTVDAIVMGYTVGKGKRAGFGVGQFLVGVRSGDEIKTVTKIGTGLTDEKFRELKLRLSKIEVFERPKEYDVHKDLFPDFWVIPQVVVEIAADEITKSPKHTAGYALRFPRLVKFRDDKSTNEATTVTEVEKLFKMQKA